MRPLRGWGPGLGEGRERGREWEVDGRNFIYCCSAVGPVLDNCGFLRPPWDGGGRGDRSRKWMAATLDFVVAQWGLFSTIVDF